MSKGNRDNPNTDAARVQAALRGLSSPSANAAFRERMKREFISGTLQSPAPRPAEVPVPWLRRFGFLGLGAAAAVAAVLAIVFFNQGPSWQLVEPLPSGQLYVNGTAVELTDAEAINRQLRPGARLAREDSTAVSIAAAGHMVVQLTPCSEVVLPRTPGRWLGRTIRARVTDGEVRFTSGPAFAGARLQIDTKTARVEMRGTTIAVIEDEASTCVCVYEGTVSIGPLGGPLEVVPAGKRKIIYNDGRPALQEDITPMERMKLQMLRDAAFPEAPAAAPGSP